ncbi:MAG: FixG Ig-like domain-containing protein, partial [Thermodesulfobacteriota bacterium]
RVEVPINMGKAGETLTYQPEIINIGKKSDSYTLTVVDELGWSPSVSPSVVTLENGGNRQVEVKVTVPSLTTKVVNWITLKAVGASGAEDNVQFRAVNISPKDKPPYPIAYPEKTTYGWSLATLIVGLPAVPIITGVETGYSEDLTPREPWPIPYGKGEFPPAAAAALVDEGRVIATGVSWFRSAPVDWYPRVLREYLPFLPQWLIDWKDPRGVKFLYYCTDPNPPILTFHTSDKVKTWLDDLRELGFEIGVQEGGKITPELLEGYSVLQIAELKTPLSDDETQAIVNWVKGGGGLLLGEQPDYQGYGYSWNSNEVLEALGVPIRFQDDELYDTENWTHDGAWFPQIYLLDPREVNPEFDVWFPEHAFSISMAVKAMTLESAPALFKTTLINEGTNDTTYTIEVTETTTPQSLGWGIEIKPAQIEVAAGENAEIYALVTVPDIESGRKRMDLNIKVTDAVQDYLTKSDRFAVLGEDGQAPPEAKLEVGQSVSHADWGEVTIEDVAWDGSTWAYIVKTANGELKLAAEGDLAGVQPGVSTWIIVPAIVVIVIVVAAVYFVRKKRRHEII